MAQDLTAFSPSFWTPIMQQYLLKENVAIALASMDWREIVNEGDTLHNPYGGYPRVQNYTKGTDITVKDISAVDDTLTVNKTRVASFYIDDVDRIQNKYSAIQEFSVVAQRQLNNAIEQDVINDGKTNAGTALDAGDIGGTSGSGILLSTANVYNIFTVSGRALIGKNVQDPNKFALIGPRTLETLQLAVATRETTLGDVVGDNGQVGRKFGFEIYVSNNLPFSATLGMATNPSADDTLTINGVVFKFVAAPVNPGDVDIGTAVDDSRLNLTHAINNTGTPGTDYIDLTDENRQLIESAGIVGVNDAAANTLAITGYGDVVVSEALTATADVWSAQRQDLLIGIKGAMALVMQRTPNIEFRQAQLRLGRFVHPYTLFGNKVFHRNKNKLVSVRIDATKWV